MVSRIFCIQRSMAVAMALMVVGGCTIHPQGEARERRDADRAGTSYIRPVEERTLPTLSATATLDELVTYSLLSNADLEQKYWNWRSAIEQITQEGTQKTNVMITFNSMITNGTTAAAMNTLGIGNDAMNNIVLPNKLETAARVALEQARAAGLRFDQARFDLQNKVISAYADFGLTAETIRLEQHNHDLLSLIGHVTSARLGTDAAMPQDVMKAQNELELSANEIEIEQSKLASQLAAINAVLNRDPAVPLTPPTMVPSPDAIAVSDDILLQRAAEQNRELQAQQRDIAAKRNAIARAKAEYLPDVGINASTDMAGATQSLMGSVMVPFLRYQAIDAGIRQAEASLHSTEAMRRHAGHDLASRIVSDAVMLRDLDRQIALYQSTLLPHARAVVNAGQTTYATARTSFLDLLDAQRSVIALERMLAELQWTRLKESADLQAMLAISSVSPSPSTTAR